MVLSKRGMVVNRRDVPRLLQILGVLAGARWMGNANMVEANAKADLRGLAGLHGKTFGRGASKWIDGRPRPHDVSATLSTLALVGTTPSRNAVRRRRYAWPRPRSCGRTGARERHGRRLVHLSLCHNDHLTSGRVRKVPRKPVKPVGSRGDLDAAPQGHRGCDDVIQPTIQRSRQRSCAP